MKILIIDNYDSFTYNLVHYIEGMTNEECVVMRNDQIDIDALPTFDRIVISPGPGLPNEAGGLLEAIANIPKETPVLAVCLGMQAYALFSGNEIYNLNSIHHGVQVRSSFDQSSLLFEGVESPSLVGLYHSWAVRDQLPPDWKPIAFSEEGVLMGMEHRQYPIYCVQFHPESILTPQGKKMVRNFLNL